MTQRRHEWTAEDDALIASMRKIGVPWEDIARHFSVSVDSVTMRLHRQDRYDPGEDTLETEMTILYRLRDGTPRIAKSFCEMTPRIKQSDFDATIIRLDNEGYVTAPPSGGPWRITDKGLARLQGRAVGENARSKED